MARRTFLIGAAAWLLLAIVGAVATIGFRTALLSALPPLAIDADALGGVLAAMAGASLAVGLVHAGVAAGLGGNRRWARSAGALLASVLAVTFLALAATAVTSALREPGSAPILAIGAVCAVLVATGYGLSVARLIGELRAGSAV